MTPTLLGRWQTRILLFIFIGLPVTALFVYYYNDWVWESRNLPIEAPFYFLTEILVLGLILDPLYIQIQRFRWDNDWPFAFQLFFSILEFFAVYALNDAGYLVPIVGSAVVPEFTIAATHFTLVLIPSFLAVLGFIQIFLVRWRFKGGELGRHGT